MGEALGLKLFKLKEANELTDARIVVNQMTTFNVHKLVLSASSLVFKAMFCNEHWNHNHNIEGNLNATITTIEITEEPCCYPVFNDFINYLYKFRVKLNLGNVLPYLILADKYEVYELLRLCLVFMNRHCGNALKAGQIVSWFEYCKASGQYNATFLFNVMSWNFAYLLKSHLFLQIPFPILTSFLEATNPSLIIHDELQLMESLEGWFVANESKPSNREIVNLLKSVKTPYLPLTTLAKASVFVGGEECKAFNFALATKFHAFNARERKLLKLSPQEGLLCEPRIYLSESWSTTFVIPRFSHFPRFGVRTEIFSTLASASRADNLTHWEWILDFYPKGLRYDKCLYIAMNKIYEVPGMTTNSVQARLTAIDNNFEIRENRGNDATSQPIKYHHHRPHQNPDSSYRRRSANSTNSHRDVDVYFLFHVEAPPLRESLGNVSNQGRLGLQTKSPGLSSALNSPHETFNNVSHDTLALNYATPHRQPTYRSNDFEPSIQQQRQQQNYNFGGFNNDSYDTEETSGTNQEYQHHLLGERGDWAAAYDYGDETLSRRRREEYMEYVAHVVKRENCKFFEGPLQQLPHHKSMSTADSNRKKKRYETSLSDHLYSSRSFSRDFDDGTYSGATINFDEEPKCSQTSSIKFEDLVPFQTLNPPFAWNEAPNHLKLDGDRHQYDPPPPTSERNQNPIVCEHDYDVASSSRLNAASWSTPATDVGYDNIGDGVLTQRPNSLRILNSFTPSTLNPSYTHSDRPNAILYPQNSTNSTTTGPSGDGSSTVEWYFKKFNRSSKTFGTNTNDQKRKYPKQQQQQQPELDELEDEVLYLKNQDALKVTVVILPRN